MSEINDNANRIIQRLKHCKTPDEIETVANEERQAVIEMNKTAEGKTRVFDIVNMKAYMLDFILPKMNEERERNNAG